MNLYQDLSHIYHEMYQDLFDYDAEFSFYKTKLEQFNINKVIEFGCGTGNLAQRFIAHGFDYRGIDLNQEMLDIAEKTLSKIYFEQGDLRTFKTKEKYEGALLTGRTISYLTTNQDILDGFKTINRSLEKGGILIFDAIDATLLFKKFDESKKELRAGNYKRISQSKPNLATGWTWDWIAQYFITKEGKEESIGQDFSTLRAFTADELKLFLNMTRFEWIERVKKETYTWSDHYYIVRKKDNI